MRDLVIVGSGPAGLSAAVYAKRAMMDVVVLEKEAFSGGQIVNTEQVDNYLGLPGISGFDMGMKFKEHADTLGVEFDDREVTAIEDHGDHKKVSLEDGSSIETKGDSDSHRRKAQKTWRSRRRRIHRCGSFILCHL